MRSCRLQSAYVDANSKRRSSTRFTRQKVDVAIDSFDGRSARRRPVGFAGLRRRVRAAAARQRHRQFHQGRAAFPGAHRPSRGRAGRASRCGRACRVVRPSTPATKACRPLAARLFGLGAKPAKRATRGERRRRDSPPGRPAARRRSRISNSSGCSLRLHGVRDVLAILDIQIVSASLQQIQPAVGVVGRGHLVQTAYLIAEVIMIPLSGFLSRAFSTRYVFAVPPPAHADELFLLARDDDRRDDPVAGGAGFIGGG